MVKSTPRPNETENEEGRRVPGRGCGGGPRRGWMGVVVVVAAALLAGPAAAQEGTGQEPSCLQGDVPCIELNGEAMPVRWSDGDTFDFLAGELVGQSVRLMGYNALESYGPVHRWGDWTAEELYDLAQEAKELARSRTWHCTTDGTTDFYDRLLVRCDDLIEAMAASGLGHLFAIDAEADPAHIAAQQQAQAQGLGMWAKGVPERIVTSVHSVSEERDVVYDRLIATSDGRSFQLAHENSYEVCQEVCHYQEDGELDSCLLYVPFEQRYGGARAQCLRH